MVLNNQGGNSFLDTIGYITMQLVILDKLVCVCVCVWERYICLFLNTKLLIVK